jgi:hypothetical protein
MADDASPIRKATASPPPEGNPALYGSLERIFELAQASLELHRQAAHAVMRIWDANIYAQKIIALANQPEGEVLPKEYV